MARDHFKSGEEGFGTEAEGYFYVIDCACGEVIEERRESPEDARAGAYMRFGLHLQGE